MTSHYRYHTHETYQERRFPTLEDATASAQKHANSSRKGVNIAYYSDEHGAWKDNGLVRVVAPEKRSRSQRVNDYWDGLIGEGLAEGLSIEDAVHRATGIQAERIRTGSVR